MKRIRLTACLIVVFTLIGTALSAQEAKFKALFIYKFAEYIEWPDGNSNVKVGVVGNSDVFDELSKFAASRDNISVMKISNASDASKCKMIYIPQSESNQTKDFATTIGNQSILIITDKKELAGKGSDIGFFTESGKLRFLISEDDIRRKKMTPSSKLLALGKSI